MRNVHYINAGAGAGKTTTLVNKLSEILKDPNNKPAEIILTTFTKAAAKEFREKTFKRLLKDGSLQAAKSLDTATIGTVHSVAEQYIQRYWSLLGYSGQFNIMSDTDKKKYINKSLNEFVDPEDLFFFHQYALELNLGTDADFWKKTIVDIISKAKAYHIDFDDFDSFSSQSCDVVDRLFVHNFDKNTFEGIAKDYVVFLDKNIANGKGKTKNASIEKKDIYDDFINKESFSNEILNDFLSSSFYKYSTTIDKDDVKAKDSGEDSKKYIQKCIALNAVKGTMVKDCIKRIFRIAKDWAENFDKYKCKNNLLDFDDLEFKFLELLGYDEVKKDISNSIKYLFVDEFQDSNPIQLEIFKKLSDLVKQSYWVGDPKQAIYGFRGSDSSLITQLLAVFPKPEKGKTSDFAKDESGNSSQLLDNSYRSVKSLVELANDVFEKAFATGAKSEIIEDVRLNSIRADGLITHPIQHWHCANVDALATQVAKILNEDVKTAFPGVYDEDSAFDKDAKLEKIIPSDIAILCRKDDHCVAVAKALREKGILVAIPETKILENAEVKLVFALLKYVKSQRYAKAELSKLLENKELKDIIKDIAKGRFNYDFEEEDKTDEEPVATESATVPSAADTTRDLFEILDERLRGLRGLNISSIIKGIIASLDLHNVVTKWDRAAARRENLDTLITQAVAFEQSTAYTTDCASISSFIKYMKNVKIEAKLDNGAEGVKVATYHKSKGLQWKIVILYSLDNDELIKTKFVTHEWCSLNLKTDEKTKKSELQLIPPFGTITEGIADEIEILANQPAGKDDNGYYKMRYDKVEGELKRLLYVGVTRARDYLVTTSIGKAQLTWINNVTGITTVSDTPVGDSVDIWGEPKHLAYYEDILDDPSVTYSGGTTTYQKLKDISINDEKKPKTIYPSSSQEKYEVKPELVKDFSSDYIDHGKIKKGESAAFGTCIHNYFAAHRWEGSTKIESNEPGNIALAKQTVENHNMNKELTDHELLTKAADTLFTYLEEKFGTGELLRETPFTYRRNNGQLVTGEIDLIWKFNDKECVLLDYKNFPAEKSYGQKVIFNDTPKNEHYVGHYFPQLGDYRAALTAADMKVTRVFVFYAVLGCLVEIKFE